MIVIGANLQALFVCGYHVGSRKNELRRIEWPQVDWEGGAIRLPGGQKKNEKPHTLPIYGDMRRWLEHQRATCPKDCVWVFHGERTTPWTITSTDGGKRANASVSLGCCSTTSAGARCGT
jgi:integrase